MLALNWSKRNTDIRAASGVPYRPLAEIPTRRRFPFPTGERPNSSFVGICYPFHQKHPGL